MDDKCFPESQIKANKRREKLYMDLKNAYNAMHKASGIEIGDKVRILRSWEPGELGTNWGNKQMFQEKVGKIGIVTRNSSPNGLGFFNVKIDHESDESTGWGYPFFCIGSH